VNGILDDGKEMTVANWRDQFDYNKLKTKSPQKSLGKDVKSPVLETDTKPVLPETTAKPVLMEVEATRPALMEATKPVSSERSGSIGRRMMAKQIFVYDPDSKKGRLITPAIPGQLIVVEVVGAYEHGVGETKRVLINESGELIG
jgi:hypothetical protein